MGRNAMHARVIAYLHAPARSPVPALHQQAPVERSDPAGSHCARVRNERLDEAAEVIARALGQRRFALVRSERDERSDALSKSGAFSLFTRCARGGI